MNPHSKCRDLSHFSQRIERKAIQTIVTIGTIASIDAEAENVAVWQRGEPVRAENMR